mmetsp:Transcript_82285/g.145851  ORF Transcript_82285/g.145851 Transcript_82285/m.145851 type:complete len:235 (+) Transcript_82285:472-1176(+)
MAAAEECLDVVRLLAKHSGTALLRLAPSLEFNVTRSCIEVAQPPQGHSLRFGSCVLPMVEVSQIRCHMLVALQSSLPISLFEEARANLLPLCRMSHPECIIHCSIQVDLVEVQDLNAEQDRDGLPWLQTKLLVPIQLVVCASHFASLALFHGQDCLFQDRAVLSASYLESQFLFLHKHCSTSVIVDLQPHRDLRALHRPLIALAFPGDLLHRSPGLVQGHVLHRHDLEQLNIIL